MLRLYDEQGRDITNQPSQFCDNPECLGEPWCSAWGICRAQEDSEEEVDSLFSELSQLLESSSTPTLPAQPLQSTLPAQPLHSSSSEPRPAPSKKQRLFAAIKSDEEVEAARATGVPAKTAQDTKYCMGVWEAWVAYRNENGDNIRGIEEMDKNQMQHWLSRFVLEVGTATLQLCLHTSLFL